MTKIYIANNAAALEALNPTHSVEAEFGDLVVEASIQTLAHHGPRSENQCPCLERNHVPEIDMVVAVSHIDLDTIGGIMAILDQKPNVDAFWTAAATIDVQGPHKLALITDNQVVIDCLNAYWAFSAQNKVFAPRDGTTADVTEVALRHIEAVTGILAGDEELLEDGRSWARMKRELEMFSFVNRKRGVILRMSSEFTNHLYGEGGKCVVALNLKFKSVTISLADPIEGISCCEVVQGLWGPEAGGHAGIAGSPRGREMDFADAEEAFSKMIELL